MWSFGVSHAGAAHAAIVTNLIPLVAIAAMWMPRGKAATASQLFGGALILGELVITRRSGRTADIDGETAKPAWESRQAVRGASNDTCGRAAVYGEDQHRRKCRPERRNR